MPRQSQGVWKDQTLQFIDQNPIDIAFERMAKVPDGAGGFTQSPTTLDPQRVRKVIQNNSQAVRRLNGDGELVAPEYKLVCRWDADVQRTDRFVLDGIDVEIIWVTDFPYERIAEVAPR